ATLDCRSRTRFWSLREKSLVECHVAIGHPSQRVSSRARESGLTKLRSARSIGAQTRQNLIPGANVSRIDKQRGVVPELAKRRNIGKNERAARRCGLEDGEA